MQFDSLKLSALKVFCDVVRHRSFSRAAAANDVSQSAASQIVLQLEKRLGTQLIDRSTRPLQATAAGKTYYEGCKGLVEQYLELESSICRSQAERDSIVQVAAIYSVGLSDMGQLVDRFMAEHPSAHVQVEYLHPDRVYERVLEATVDFGLVSFPRGSRELTVLPWREDDMFLACAPNHRLARRNLVRPTELEGEKYIGFDKGLLIRKEVDRFLREQNITVHVTLEFDSIENIKQAIAISGGVALLPEPTLRREVQAGTLAAVPLENCRLVRPLGIILRRHHRPSAMAKRFLDLLMQSTAHGQPQGRTKKFQVRSNGRHRGRNGATRRGKKGV